MSNGRSNASLDIGIVHSYRWPEVRRGGERYMDDLATYLRSRGHTVTTITGTNARADASDGTDGEEPRLRYPRLEKLEPWGLGPLETFGFRTFPFLRGRRFDLVHSLIPTGALAAHFAGQRTVYTSLGPPPRRWPLRPLRRGFPPRVRERLMVSAVRRSDAATSLSRANADEFEKICGLRPELLAPGVRLDQFALNAAPRTGAPKILFCSALIAHKGLVPLMQAFMRVLERVPDARLVLAGPGEHEWALKNLGADARRLEGSVDVIGVGEVSDLPVLYGSAHVTVLPSRNEAFGLVLVESLACGTPVVATTPGGVTDIIDRSDIGRLAPYADTDALATALIECIDLARRPDTPVACRAHARRWDWNETIGPAHEALYARVLKR